MSVNHFVACLSSVGFAGAPPPPPPQVSLKLGQMYSEMIFLQGYIHCDPHPGNVLVRAGQGGGAEIILLDHGLYSVSCVTTLCTSVTDVSPPSATDR